MVNDVSRAFFCAPARRQVFVEIAEEDKDHRDMVGELNYSMYGTRDAAQNWGEECADTMKAIGFEQGKASPCTFFHKGRGIRTYIHGDDFVSVAKDADLKWLKTEIEKKYELKTQVLGPNKPDLQEVKVLNRISRWTTGGIKYEADPRHAELIIKDLGLSKVNGVSTPGTKEEGRTRQDNQDLLDNNKASE